MTAIILAAGLSKRFGRKKLLMDINRKPMINHVVDVVLSMGFKDAILVYHHDEVKKAVENEKIRFVHNPVAFEGLSTSVRCGIHNSNPEEDFIFFNGDQPFIDRNTVNKIYTTFREGKGSIIVPKYNGRKGNPVIFAARWRSELEKISGDVGGRQIIEAHAEEVYFVEVAEWKAGMDIDTWEQYIELGGDEK